MDTCRNGHPRSESIRDSRGKWRCQTCARAAKERFLDNTKVVKPPPPDNINVVNGDRDVDLILTEPITLDELLKRFKVDLTEWECVRFTCNAYPVSQKGPDGTPVVVQLYQAKAHLRRIEDARALSEMRDGLLTDIAKAPIFSVKVGTRSQSGVMREFAPMDPHLNKLAWGKETGGADYDTDIASHEFREGIVTLMERSSGYNAELSTFVLGNDFFNVDGASGTTTAGTPQDVDSRYPKMFRAGVDLVRWAVHTALEASPVHIVFVSGNHDGTTLWMMGEVIAALFETHKHVTVDNAPTLRKYQRWGNVLLGYTHGDKEKPGDLPLIMAHERAADWATTSHREWHLGHLHKSMKWEDEYGGVRVRRLPSITASDAYHASRGYVGSIRATEAYLWDKKAGYLGHLSHQVKP